MGININNVVFALFIPHLQLEIKTDYAENY